MARQERADRWSRLDGGIYAVVNIRVYVRRSVLGGPDILGMDTWASPVRHNSTCGNHRQKERVMGKTGGVPLALRRITLTKSMLIPAENLRFLSHSLAPSLQA